MANPWMDELADELAGIPDGLQVQYFAQWLAQRGLGGAFLAWLRAEGARRHG